MNTTPCGPCKGSGVTPGGGDFVDVVLPNGEVVERWKDELKCGDCKGTGSVLCVNCGEDPAELPLFRGDLFCGACKAAVLDVERQEAA